MSEQNLDIQLEDEQNFDVNLENDVVYIGTGEETIHTDTTANWNAQRTLIAKRNHIYVYSDYTQVSGVNVPAIKIGDGLAYLIDLPFVEGNDQKLTNHASNTTIHVTADERLFWNNKVTCFLSNGDSETVVFSKAEEE